MSIWCKSICNGKDKRDANIHDTEKYTLRLSEGDYNFWRHLAMEFSKNEERKANEHDVAIKQWESIQTICEEVEYEKLLLRQLKGKVSEMERMMTLSHVYLENIKHLASIKFGSTDDGSASGIRFGSNKINHILSRQSPYPNTPVQRVPVPDKYVPWEVMWHDYDPVAYTKQKYDFPIKLQDYVDEDILMLQELQLDEVRSKLPVYKWNSSATNPAGITIDRTSWCLTSDAVPLVYKLDNGIPRNPFGRCGLRGKGTLPRWGPNHYVLLIITR